MMTITPIPVFDAMLKGDKSVGTSVLHNIPLLNAIPDAYVARVNYFTLLGVYFSTDLNWKHRVDFMLNKVAKRI